MIYLIRLKVLQLAQNAALSYRLFVPQLEIIEMDQRVAENVPLLLQTVAQDVIEIVPRNQKQID